MKIRAGFVSNSSSSSFLVGIKNPDSTVGRFLLARADAYQEFDIGGGARGEQGLRSYGYDDILDDEDTYYYETLQKYDLDMVVVASVDHGDTDFPALLDAAVENGDIEIIMGD